MQVKTGSYTGNATDNRAITEVGFAPDLVMIKGSGLSRGLAMRSSSMTGDNTASTGFAFYADGIQSLDADGFTVGTDVYENASGTYWWIAFKSDVANCKVGTYTGNGADARGITGVGFQPNFVLIFPNSSADYTWRSSEHSGDASQRVNSTVAPAANLIESLDADGFTVGTDAAVNANTTAYYYLALKNITGFTKVGSYTGNGADNRSITGVGFQPIFVMSQSHSGFIESVNFGTMGDSTGSFAAGTHAADYIQAFQADGFQVGTANGANQNTTVFRYLAIKEGTSPVASGGGSTVGGKGGGKKGGGGGGKGGPPAAPPAAPSGSFRSVWSTARKSWT